MIISVAKSTEFGFQIVLLSDTVATAKRSLAKK